MAYTKQNWRRLKSELIPVEPENLEQIEDGIVELESRIQAGLGEVETTTTTTKADYLIEKPTEDFKVLEKVPFEEDVTYEAVVTVDEVEYSYSVQLVDGASLDFDYYDLTGFKVLTCGTLLGTDAKGLMIIQDCIASLSPLNAAVAEGYSSIYSSYDKVVIKDAYVDTKTTHKIKNQDPKYTEAFQSDVLCTDEKDVSFIKNNPIQKELVKTKKQGYKMAFDTTDFELLLGEEDLIKLGFIKDTVTNSKIDFDADPLTITVTSGENEPETFELMAIPGEDYGLPKNATAYINDDFIDYPFIIRGLTKIDPENNEFIGAVDENGLPLYDEEGEMVADNDVLFIFAQYYPESVRAILDPTITINETLTEEVEKEHFKLNEQFVEDFQADFAEGDSTKAGFIKNMPFYSANKNLPGFTIAEPLAANEEFKLLAGTTKNSLILDKEGNYEVALFEMYSDGTTDGESFYGFFPGIIYNRTELLEIMQADNFAYKMSASEIAALDSILPADSTMLVVNTGDEIIPLIFTHVHISIADNGNLQVVTDENAEENYFTYLRFGSTDIIINITGKNIPANNFKIKQIKKLPSEFIEDSTSVTNYLDPYDDEKAVSGYGIWQYLNDRVRTQVLSTSDGHIKFVKADDGSRNIDFSVETVGIGYNEDLKTTEKDTIVGAINELIDKNKTKLQVADSGINNIYYTDKNGNPQEQLIKQNYVTAADKHTCYEALIDDSKIYWCPTHSTNQVYGLSTETFNVYALNPSTKTVSKVAVVKDVKIKDTLTQAFANSSIICVNLRIYSGYERWIHKSPLGSAFDKDYREPLTDTTILEIYLANKQYVSVGFSKGIVTSATITDISTALTDLPATLKNTGASVFSSSSTTGGTRTEIKTGRQFTVTKYITNSYRRNILTQGAVMGGTTNTGVNYVLRETSTPTTYGNSANSNLQLIVDGNRNGQKQAQRSLDSEGVEIYTYDGTDYTGIDNNVHSTYIYARTSESSSNLLPFCLTSAGEAIWRNVTTGAISERKTIQTDSSSLFDVNKLKTTKLYQCTQNGLLYVVNDSSIYAINIFDENPTATIIKAYSSDEFTFNDDCCLITFGENFVLLTNGNTLKVLQVRESFNCNELKLGDTAQDKIVLKDAETGSLYSLTIRDGQVVVTAVTA